MDNIKMAHIIVEKASLLPNLTEYEIMQHCAVEMAKWKDEQYEEEKKELLALVNMLPINEKNQTIIEDLKAILQ